MTTEEEKDQTVATEAGSSEAEGAVAEDDVATGDFTPASAKRPDVDNVADAGALFIGVSRKKDEYGASVTDRDHMSDDELLAMGVEPDAGPSNTLVGTFAALTLAVGATAVFAAMLFLNTLSVVEGEVAGGIDHVLGAARSEAAAVLDGYAAVADGDGATTGYRVPVAVGIDLLVDRPELLGRHPMGAMPEPVVVPTEGSGEGSGEGLELVPTGVLGEGQPTMQLQLQNTLGDAHVAPGGGAAVAPGHEGHGH